MRSNTTLWRPIQVGLSLVATLGFVATLLVPTAHPAQAQTGTPERYFDPTGYSIPNNAFWDYFQHRGGVKTFGYPVSREFLLLGFPTQIFQRLVMQQRPDGSVQTMNLLDEGLMPYSKINGSTFPSPNADLVSKAPTHEDPNYAADAITFVRENAPDEWNGLPVNFGAIFFGTVTCDEAYPNSACEESLLPGFDLELWGMPTSPPAYDPNNHNFVYQRFQRGIMHYDATTGATEGLLLADYFKAILTGQNLPDDLAQEAASSPFFRQYNNSMPGGLARPWQLPNSNLQNAFEPDYNQPYTPNLAPVPSSAQPSAMVAPPGPPFQGSLDNSVDGQTFAGQFTISGWVEEPSGVQSVQLWIDGQNRQSAQYGIYRADQACDCGFQATIDPSALGLGSGQHSLQVVAVANDGRSGDFAVQTFVYEPGSRPSSGSSSHHELHGGLDTELAGRNFDGPFTIKGWARDQDNDTDGIRRVEVYIDGEKRLDARYGLQHDDPDCNCGYEATIDPRALGLERGEHHLFIRIVAKNGDTRDLETHTFHVFEDQGVLHGGMETHLNDREVTGPFTARGWATDKENRPDGISRAEIWIDGEKRMDARYGLHHSDPDCDCGFEATVDSSGLKAGEHSLDARIVAKDGDTHRLGSESFRVGER